MDTQTTDTIRTKPSTKAYRDGWDRIFGKKNQCMGCQAGWPLNGSHYHKAAGGYPDEIVGCTKDRYSVDS